MIRITRALLSIPPYISTNWDQIQYIRQEKELFIIQLTNGTSVEIPDLTPEIIEQIFAGHAAYIEMNSYDQPKTQNERLKLLEFPVKLTLSALDQFSQALKHNPAQQNLSPIPEEMVEKLQALSKTIPVEDLIAFPKPEHNCMCMYCQITRNLQYAIGERLPENHPLFEETHDAIPSEELAFEQWNITSIGTQHYLVTNKLDTQEQYTVFLGDKLHCTCGKPRCEHIVAVLRS